MSEMINLLSGTNLFLLAFSVLILDIPRYTLSLVSLALLGRKYRNVIGVSRASVSVIIPTFNGGSGLYRSIASLRRQTLLPVEIIVVDDGSTDQTRSVAEQARALVSFCNLGCIRIRRASCWLSLGFRGGSHV